MEFLTSKELGLNPAGYLVSSVSNKPVTHEKFVAEQKAAEFIVKLAEATVGKNFKESKVESLNALSAEILKSISETSKTSYVEMPEKPKSALVDELVNYALNFDGYNETKEITKEINRVMQEYNTINDVEKVGDYFSEGLVKLAKIYSIEEILTAVKTIAEISKK